MKKNKQLTESDLRKLLFDRVSECSSQRALSFELGITQSYLSDIINGRRSISSEVANRLGYDRVAIYVPKE